jgi:hypothetical protein
MHRLDRRAFLATGTALALLAGDALAAGAKRGSEGALFVGCRTVDERHVLTALDGAGNERFSLTLPDRGHSIALHPTAHVGVVFARRPGRFAVVFDHAEGTALRRIDAAEGRHFYGHGAFSADGRWLFTTENAWQTGEGVIAVRDAADAFREVDAMPSHGIGPHDVRLMPDGQRLVVANGGIRTHPDRDREKLNLDTMRPNLALVALESGRLEARFELPLDLHQLSIRHLDVTADGRVAVAMQHEGGKGDAVPLVGLLDGDGLKTFAASAEMARRLRHYIGSIAFDRTGEVIAASAPRASRLTLWDARTGASLGVHPIPDGCGIAAIGARGAFVATTSGGRCYALTVDQKPQELAAAPLAGDWDNHLVAHAGAA